MVKLANYLLLIFRMPSHRTLSDTQYKHNIPQRDRPPLIVIVGPSAVGKTEIAINLADSLDGEIVSADSRLFYRGMDIGTDKPSLYDRSRVPHHLIDVANPDEVWSLALFQKAAQQAIGEILQRGKRAFLVGGTGQYIYALLKGWKIPKTKPDLNLRTILEDWAGTIGTQGLHSRLAILDPQAAANIDHRNLRRTVRALEVILRTGQRFSILRSRSQQPYNSLILGLTRPRPELYKRVDQRIAKMFEKGLISEVQNLLDEGYSPTLPTLSAIGYQEVILYLHGEITQDEAIIRMKRRSRQFIRRQGNWFKKNDPDIHWFRVDTGTEKAMMAAIRNWEDSR
jgi:tRNA dimethylallyltransferase